MVYISTFYKVSWLLLLFEFICIVCSYHFEINHTINWFNEIGALFTSLFAGLYIGKILTENEVRK